MPASDHHIFEAPTDPTVKIWRYMDFAKFVSLLETRSLFFNRSDRFDDTFEGSVTKQTFEEIRPLFEDQDEYESLVKIMRETHIYLRQYTYVNCWHMNSHESTAMWKLYTRTNESIAIQTTYKHLFDSLPSECHIGVVKYIDYATDAIPAYNSYFFHLHKRKSFAHEQEIRAIIQDDNFEKYSEETSCDPTPNPFAGKNVKVDLMQLIETIYVSPTAPKWFYELVGNLIKRYGLDIPIHPSQLDAAPQF